MGSRPAYSAAYRSGSGTSRAAISVLLLMGSKAALKLEDRS